MRMDEIIEKNEQDLDMRNLFIRLMLILIVGCGSIGVGLWLVL